MIKKCLYKTKIQKKKAKGQQRTETKEPKQETKKIKLISRKSWGTVAMFPKTCASTSVEKIKGGAHQIHGTGKEDGSLIIQLCDDALMQSLDSQSQRIYCVSKGIWCNEHGPI